MTLDELKSCKTDEQGRPMVRNVPTSAIYTVLWHDERGCLLQDPDGPRYVCDWKTATIAPVPASPHADLVRRLGCTVRRLVSQGHYEDASAVREAAAALEGESA